MPLLFLCCNTWSMVSSWARVQPNWSWKRTRKQTSWLAFLGKGKQDESKDATTLIWPSALCARFIHWVIPESVFLPFWEESLMWTQRNMACSRDSVTFYVVDKRDLIQDQRWWWRANIVLVRWWMSVEWAWFGIVAHELLDLDSWMLF